MKNVRTLLTAGAVAATTIASLTSLVPSHGPGDHDAGRPGPRAHSTCAHTHDLFCEDFEQQPVGGASSLGWGLDTRHGTLTVERDRGGNQVLHAHTEQNGKAFLTVNDFSAPGGSFWGRLRVKVDQFPTAPDWAHFTLVEATGAGSSEVVRPLGGQFAPTVGPDAVFWGVGADGGPTGDWTNWRESAPAVADQWQCVELQWSADDDRVSVYFDGVEQQDLEVSGSNHGGNDVPFVLPDANTIKVGWQLYQGGPTPDHFDVWYDDIAFSADRLGC